MLRDPPLLMTNEESELLDAVFAAHDSLGIRADMLVRGARVLFFFLCWLPFGLPTRDSRWSAAACLRLSAAHLLHRKDSLLLVSSSSCGA